MESKAAAQNPKTPKPHEEAQNFEFQIDNIAAYHCRFNCGQICKAHSWSSLRAHNENQGNQCQKQRQREQLPSYISRTINSMLTNSNKSFLVHGSSLNMQVSQILLGFDHLILSREYKLDLNLITCWWSHAQVSVAVGSSLQPQEISKMSCLVRSFHLMVFAQFTTIVLLFPLFMMNNQCQMPSLGSIFTCSAAPI